MKITISVAIAACVSLAVAGSAVAAMDAAAALKTRSDGMKSQGAALKGFGQGLAGGAPAGDLKAFSAKLVQTSGQLPGWFPSGSGPESGLKTKAKPDIWTDPAGFKAAADNLKVQAGKLDTAVAGGDMDAIKAQFGATRAACKSCHEKYEVQD